MAVYPAKAVNMDNRITFNSGKPPSHNSAQNAGVASSRTPWDVLESAKKRFIGSALFLNEVCHVIIVFLFGNLEYACERIVDQTGELAEFKTVLLCPMFQLAGADQFLIGVSPPWKQTQNIFTAKDHKQEGLGRAVDRRKKCMSTRFQ